MDIATVPHMEFDVVRNEAEQIVQEQIAYLKEKADEALDSMNDALDDLRKELTSANMPGTSIDYDYIDDTIETDVETNRPTPPDFPSTDEVDPPTREDLIDIDVPTFPDIPTFDEDAPDDEFSYNENEYQSTLLDNVKDSLTTWIIDGGTGLSTEVEEAIWERARSRLAEEWERATDDVMGYWSARGFNLPTGPLQAALRRVNNDFQQKLDDLNREILIKQAELAQNNTQFAHTMSVQLEKHLMDHFNSVADRMLEAAKTTVLILYQIYSEKVKAYGLQVEAKSVEIEALSKTVDAKVAINKGKTDAYLADVSRYKEEIAAIIAVIDGEARLYAAKVDGYRADIDLARAEMNVAIERLKALISQSRNQTELQIKEAEVTLQAYISSLGLNIEVSKAIATILEQIVASALGAINTSVGLDDRSAREYSGRYSHNEHLNNAKQHHLQEYA